MIRWLCYFPVMILVGVMKYPLALIAPLFATMQEGLVDNNNGVAVEPRLPRWLSFFQTDDNSLWGDAGHKARVGDYKSYFGMVQWLWRNGFHNFNYTVLGCPALPMPERTDDVWYWKRPDGYWLYRRFIPITYGKKLELFLGWNLYGVVNGRCKYVFSVRLK